MEQKEKNVRNRDMDRLTQGRTLAATGHITQDIKQM